jgi:hypothetical protein
MTGLEANPVAISVDKTIRVSGLLIAPAGAKACYVLAHGAGAGMTHSEWTAVMAALSAVNVAQ